MKRLALIILITFLCLVTVKNLEAETSECLDLKVNLRLGSKDTINNQVVTNLQGFLYEHKYLKVSPTGYFGSLTDRAIKDFQKKENLPQTGIVGTLTRKKIKDTSCVDKTTDMTEIKKVEMSKNTDKEIITKSNKLPYKGINLKDWQNRWGDVSMIDNNMNLKASAETNGAQVVLKNSSEWIDYKFTANILIKQSNVTLISRYMDDENFIGCSFSGKYIEIIERIDGKTNIVAYTTLEYYPYNIFFNNDLNIAMRVKGNSVGCLMIGSEDNVTFNNVDRKLSRGGIGIQIWLADKDIANIQIKNVTIESI